MWDRHSTDAFSSFQICQNAGECTLARWQLSEEECFSDLLASSAMMQSFGDGAASKVDIKNMYLRAEKSVADTVEESFRQKLVLPSKRHDYGRCACNKVPSSHHKPGCLSHETFLLNVNHACRHRRHRRHRRHGRDSGIAGMLERVRGAMKGILDLQICRCCLRQNDMLHPARYVGSGMCESAMLSCKRC